MNRALPALCAVLLLSACALPSWWTGKEPEIKRAPGERLDVVLAQSGLKAEETAADVAIAVPEQTNLAEWPNHNTAMLTPHIGLTGLTHSQSATAGEGNDFSRGTVASPVVSAGLVLAMDAAGIVSAHNESEISQVKWVNRDGTSERVPDTLGGGMAIDGEAVFATTGYGNLRSIDVASGKTLWSIEVGAPVRGAPAIGEGMVVVLTADNQTLAFERATGKPRWEHRGIRESAGYFSNTSPVISDGVVVSAYSSGEVFAIRAESGSVLWTDTLGSTVKTRAAAVFSGIDADPIVQDGVVVVTSASGEMQASALLNGRPLWQKRVGSHSTPWSAGNALFVLSDTQDLAALLKRDGSVRWAISLAPEKKQQEARVLYGPILAGNALLVLDAEGTLTTYKPDTGQKLGSFELTSRIASSPVIAGGALYVMTKDARLYKYY